MKLLELVVVNGGPNRQWRPQPERMVTLELSGLDRHLDRYYSYHFRHLVSALIESVPALTIVPQNWTTEIL